MARDLSRPSGSRDCPECGCNLVELINAGQRWGRVWATFECDHCGRQFTVGQKPEQKNGQVYRVPHPRLKCPRCESVDVETTSSPVERGGIKNRYHTCRGCQLRFATFEQIANRDRGQ